MRKVLMSTGVLLALASLAPRANAGPVTYTFSQTGWAGAAGFGSSLSGSFTGTPEPSGFILQGDLSAFTADYEVNGPIGTAPEKLPFGLANLTLFSFEPGAFDFAAMNVGTSAKLCSGAAASFGLCGPGGSVSGEFTIPSITIGFLTIISDDETTTDAATVTLVPPTPVPGPAPVSVLLAGLLGLAAVRRT